MQYIKILFLSIVVISCTQKINSSSNYEKLDSLMTKGEYEKGVSKSSSMIQKDPKDGELYLYRRRFNKKLENWDKCLEDTRLLYDNSSGILRQLYGKEIKYYECLLAKSSNCDNYLNPLILDADSVLNN